MLLQSGETQPGGGVAAGAEGQPRVQAQLHPVPGLGLLPVRHHDEPFTDLHGLIEGLPVVLPVRVLDAVHGYDEGGVIGVDLFQLRHGHAHSGHLGEALVALLGVECDPALAGHGAVQLLIHIVPVLLVLLQKLVEVRLILHGKAVNTQGDQHVFHRLQAGRGGINVQGKPFHRFFLIFQFFNIL